MSGDKIASAAPWFPGGEIERILDGMRGSLESGRLISGPALAELEESFAAYVGCRHAVALSNGTTALEVALRWLDLDGAEVVVPTNTFLASANAVLFAGGRPVLVDTEAASLGLGVEQVEQGLGPRTRAVMVVHVAGLIPPGIGDLRGLCAERGLFLLEDAAHAHGASWQGRRAGALGDAAAFSFFPTKVMTTAEGGMLTTDSDELATFARTFRNHGVPPGERVHRIVGHNYRLDELRAHVGLSQLRTLDRALERRRRVAATYGAALAALPEVELPELPPATEHAYYKYPVVLPDAELRGAVATALAAEHGIATGTVYWPPCHLHPVVRERPDLYRVAAPLEVAEELLPRVLCLPIHPGLDDGDVARVIAALTGELERRRRGEGARR